MARQKKAKTAYELLERVCEAIEAHPLNYYQGMWVTRRRGADGFRNWDEPLPLELDVLDNTCGTAFCRAGWVCQLHDGRMPSDTSIGYRCNDILDMDEDDTTRLYLEEMKAAPGTAEYVRQGVRGVRAFMKKHAVHLKARSLRGV